MKLKKSFVLLAALSAAAVVNAQELDSDLESRAGKFDAHLLVQTMDARRVTVNSGARELDIESVGMSGVGVSYYLTEDLAASLEFLTGATEFDDNDSGLEAIDAGLFMLNLNVDYYVSALSMFDNKLTPYVSGGVGCLTFAEEVDDADDDYDSSTDMAFNLGAGLRYDFNKDIFIRGGYRLIATEIKDSGTENFNCINLALGWVF